MILSKQLKEIENYTLALTFVEKSYIDPKRSKKIKIAIIVAILLLLVIAIGVGAFIIHKNRKQDAIASVNEGKQNAEEYIKNGNMEKQMRNIRKL